MRSRRVGRLSAASHGSDTGAALAFVVLMMLALLTLAHGALLASLSERAGSRMAVRELRLRGAADHALATALSQGHDRALDSMTWWDVRAEELGPVDDVLTRSVLRKLGPESWLVEGRAGDSSAVEARSARLAWSMDPLARILALRGAVTVGAGAVVTIAGLADARSPAEVRAPLEAGACDPWEAGLAGHYASVPLSVVAPAADSLAPVTLGLLDFERIRDAAPLTVSGSGTPTPEETLGACVEDGPWVWGDPDQPWRPCGAHLPLRGSPGALEVQGGVGQGVLVVDGDLSLTTGARYYGLVVVRGTLRLEGGAGFEGLALARDGVTIAAGSTLLASACWALRALNANRALLGDFVPVSDSRIGPM